MSKTETKVIAIDKIEVEEDFNPRNDFDESASPSSRRASVRAAW